MKKVVVASLLAVSALSAVSIAPSLGAGVAYAQDAAAPAAAGQVTLSPAEFADYDNAVNKQTTPQTKTAAIEAYLTKYPQSSVKADVLQQLMVAYVAFDHAKAIDAADRLLQVDPNNLRALTFEVFLHKEAADALTDAAAKQSALDQAGSFATKGLAATQPKGMSDADYNALKTTATPIFESAIGTDDLGKKDYAGAIEAFKAELAAMPVADTQKPGTALQDTYFLGQAYYASTPPDLVNCTFYATRAATFAPDNFKAQLQPLATYCYKKYHGGTDGYEAVTAAAQANLNPPSGFAIVPAPTAEDIVAKTIASTPDLATLALSDKEYIIQNGKPEDADKVFATVKGKSVSIPDGVVMDGSTASVVLVAVSDDAVQGKVADFTFNMKTPLKAVPATGTKITLSGTYDSYTQKPVMLVMNDGEEVAKKAPAKKATTTVHHKK